MKPPRSGDMAPIMAVLGLVVQKADTAAGIALRLEEEFPEARFSDNAAHNNLPKLARDGYVLLVKRGERRSLDLYKGTPKGKAIFREWIRESDAAPLGWRDALRGKLALAELEDIPEVLGEICGQEETCDLEYALAHRRVSGRRKKERNVGKPLELRARLMDILDADEANLWGLRLVRLRKLRKEIEALELEFQPPGGDIGDG